MNETTEYIITEGEEGFICDYSDILTIVCGYPATVEIERYDHEEHETGSTFRCDNHPMTVPDGLVSYV